MPRRKKILVLDDGTTRLEGYNVGSYPRHHFAFAKNFHPDFGWPLRIASVGDDEWVEGCLRKRSNSQILALELVVEGSFRFLQDGGEYIVEPGGIFVVRPGSDSQMSLCDAGYGKKKVMEIVGPILPSLLSLTGLEKQDAIRPTNVSWLVAQFDLAYQVMENTPADFMRTTSAIAYEVLVELGRSAIRSRLPVELRRVVELMERSVRTRLTVADVCRHAQLSQSTMHRMFVEHFGESPISYFINLKMHVAQSMLAGSAYSIKEIAHQLGYDNQLYFSSQFKKRVGVSPRAYQVNARFEEMPTSGSS